MAEINVPILELENALRKVKSNKPYVQVKVQNQIVKDVCQIGKKYWFEYHCEESHESSDAPVWYHSHQQCIIVKLSDCDPVGFTTFEERAYAGDQFLYRVRFDDGLEWDVFEDELLLSPDDFCRPDPPAKRNVT